MTESERLRKEMEERGLLGTTGKKVIVSAAQKEINEKKGGTAKSRSAGSASRTASKTTDSAKHVPDTNLFRGMQLNRPTARKTSAPTMGKDSAVLQRAKALSANKGLSGKEREKQIGQAQKELGRIRDKNLLASFLGNKEAKARISQVTKLQGELSKQQKRTAFGAGFGQAAGLDIYDTAVKKIAKKTGNTALSKQMAAQDKVRQEVKTANKKSYGRGELAGELTQAGILYGTAGAAAEKAALKGVGKLTGGKTLGKAGTFATRMLGQQAADTMVNTPMTIAAGMADGKSRKEIAKDIGKQEATDAAFNVWLAALGAGAKKVGEVLEKATEGKRAVQASRETAKKELLEAAVKKETETVRKGRKKLLNEADLPELAKEYSLMNDDGWWADKTKEIGQKFGNDAAGATKELERLISRKEELEDMLGIKTKKVQQMEKSLQVQMVKRAEHILGMSGAASREEGRKLMKGAMQEVAQNGKISIETRDSIFKQLFENGSTDNRAMVDKELKERLRKLKLTISKQDAGDIADFGAWRKGTRGKLGGVRVGEKGNVDVLYMELSDRYPEFFPKDIVVPSEQLQKIADVAEGMKYRQIPLAETVDDGMKAGMRDEFERAMDDLQIETAKLTRYTNERAEKQMKKLLREGQLPDYSRVDTESMKQLYDERRQLRKAAEKVRGKINLTAVDKLILEKMLSGEIDAARARELAGINADDLMRLYAAEQPLRKVENSIRGYKEYASRNAYEGAAKAVGSIDMRDKGAEGWRDLGPMRLMRETQERILDMVAPNREKAKELKEYFFDPIHENERQRALFKTEFIDRIKKTGISTKKNISIKKADGSTVKTSESALVQFLGESKYKLQQFERKKGWATAEQITEELQLQREVQAIESSLTAGQLAKIDGGIRQMTEIYKEIHPKINEALIRNGYDPIGYIEGYFPHMSFDDPENLMEIAARKLGFDFSAKELPMDIAGRTEGFRPGKKWSGNLLERKGEHTDYDALRAFDQYIDNISDVIYHTDDIKRLRAYEDYMRYTLSEDGIKANVDAIRARKDLSVEKKMEEIEKEYGKSKAHTLQNYVNNVRLYTDLLAGKKHNVDRILENHLFGRKVYKVLNEIENRVAGNMVAGNVGSALTNFIPITQGMGSMSVKSNLRGLKEALAYMSRDGMDELTKKSAFLATRDNPDLLYKTALRKISEAGGNLNPLQWMEAADKFCTQAVWRSRYYDNVAKGMGEKAAIKNADEFARGLFAGRSKGAMPTAFSSKTLKPLTMFQLEVNNQISYLMKDIPKDAQGSVLKMMKAYSGFIIGAYVYNDVYEKLTGRRSALDPFSMANEAFGDLTGTQVRNSLDILEDAASGNGLQLTEDVKKAKPSDALENLLAEAGENMPFVGGVLFDGGRIPVQSALPSVTTIAGAIGNAASGDESREKARQKIKNELEKPLWYLAMPTAGGQARKTIKGLETMTNGGSTIETNDGPELQFAVDKDKKANWAQALLFGKWATDGGKAYMKDKSMKLGAEQTETYKKLVAAGAKNTLAFDEVNHVRSGEKKSSKMTVLRASLLNEEQKGILYYDMVAGDKEREVLDHFKDSGNRWRLADCMSRMGEFEQIAPKRETLKNAALSDEEKEYLYLYRTVNKDSIEKERNRIRAFSAAGLGMDAYLSVKNKLQELNDSDMKSKEKKQAFVHWMYESGYSNAQVQTVKDNFAFSGGYTVKW